MLKNFDLAGWVVAGILGAVLFSGVVALGPAPGNVGRGNKTQQSEPEGAKQGPTAADKPYTSEQEAYCKDSKEPKDCIIQLRTAEATGQVDPAIGTVTGVIADVTKEFGRRENVPISITPLPTAAAVLAAVRSGTADIGFVAPNPERTGVVLYSNTYMLVQQSALVRADSPLRSVAELDRSGHVVGINTDDSVGVWLRQRLSQATVRPTADYTLRDAVQWLQSGEVVAFAGGRQRLGSGTRHVQGLRMLDNNFYGVPQTIAVSLDQDRRLALVNSALRDFWVSGLLAGWIARSGIDGLSVAPLATQSR